MNWTYIIIGLILTAILLFGALQLWFWTLKQKEIKRGQALVDRLASNGTPKLTKEEQFKFLDGNLDFRKIQETLKTKEVDLLVLDYFIDVAPEEYLEHLRMNNPPNSWLEDTYGEVSIDKHPDKCELHFYDHGNRIKTQTFADYDTLLKFLVFDRLTNTGHKYKKKMNKNYYAQQGV